MLKDMTPAQATRWVKQEAAKVKPGQEAARIASGEATIAMAEEYGLAKAHPGGIAAQRALIALLTERMGPRPTTAAEELASAEANGFAQVSRDAAARFAALPEVEQQAKLQAAAEMDAAERRRKGAPPLPAAWLIEYLDNDGAGDADPCDYPTKEAAKAQARERMASGDMPWATVARVWGVDAEWEPIAGSREVVR